MENKNQSRVQSSISNVQAASANKTKQSTNEIDPEKLMEQYLVRTETPTQT